MKESDLLVGLLALGAFVLCFLTLNQPYLGIFASFLGIAMLFSISLRSKGESTLLKLQLAQFLRAIPCV